MAKITQRWADNQLASLIRHCPLLGCAVSIRIIEPGNLERENSGLVVSDNFDNATIFLSNDLEDDDAFSSSVVSVEYALLAMYYVINGPSDQSNHRGAVLSIFGAMLNFVSNSPHIEAHTITRQ